jgi:hypothetical protein
VPTRWAVDTCERVRSSDVIIGSTKTLTPAVCPGPLIPRANAAKATIRQPEKRVAARGAIGASTSGILETTVPRTSTGQDEPRRDAARVNARVMRRGTAQGDDATSG